MSALHSSVQCSNDHQGSIGALSGVNDIGGAFTSLQLSVLFLYI